MDGNQRFQNDRWTIDLHLIHLHKGTFQEILKYHDCFNAYYR